MAELNQPSTVASPSPAFIEAFKREAGEKGFLPFDRFMALALYDPLLGYYRQNRARVGFARGTDFYTSSNTLLFAELVTAACKSLLYPRPLSDYTFVEIGAEPGAGLLNRSAHPFAAIKSLRLGEPLRLKGPCVVFSNELFDAQPFRRLGFAAGIWQEFGVGFRELEGFYEIILPSRDLPGQLPDSMPEGYRLDWPADAAVLAKQLADEPWSGLFLAFDYGKTWRELIGACPAGTARAYFQHTQSNALLTRPGEQDLTCHICWDTISQALESGNFPPAVLESQEAFFVHHAADSIGSVMQAEAARFSPRKLSLMQLLHPTHLGQKFQVLWAKRDDQKTKKIGHGGTET